MAFANPTSNKNVDIYTAVTRLASSTMGIDYDSMTYREQLDIECGLCRACNIIGNMGNANKGAKKRKRKILAKPSFAKPKSTSVDVEVGVGVDVGVDVDDDSSCVSINVKIPAQITEGKIDGIDEVSEVSESSERKKKKKKKRKKKPSNSSSISGQQDIIVNSELSIDGPTDRSDENISSDCTTSVTGDVVTYACFDVSLDCGTEPDQDVTNIPNIIDPRVYNALHPITLENFNLDILHGILDNELGNSSDSNSDGDGNNNVDNNGDNDVDDNGNNNVDNNGDIDVNSNEGYTDDLNNLDDTITNTDLSDLSDINIVNNNGVQEMPRRPRLGSRSGSLNVRSDVRSGGKSGGKSGNKPSDISANMTVNMTANKRKRGIVTGIDHNPPPSRVWKLKVSDYLALSSNHVIRQQTPHRGGIVMVKSPTVKVTISQSSVGANIAQSNVDANIVQSNINTSATNVSNIDANEDGNDKINGNEEVPNLAAGKQSVTRTGYMFGFGRDRKSTEITDFGGHMISCDETIIDTCLREYREETLGLIHVDMETIKSCNMYICATDAVIILPVNLNTNSVSSEFSKRFLEYRMRGAYPEVSQIVWFNEVQMDEVIAGRRIYRRLSNFLKGCGKPNTWLNGIDK